jgi:cytoskeletal protein CcmA (bactofilin family)
MAEQVCPMKISVPAMPTAQIKIVGHVSIDRDFGKSAIKVNKGSRVLGHTESHNRSGAVLERTAQALTILTEMPPLSALSALVKLKSPKSFTAYL